MNFYLFIFLKKKKFLKIKKKKNIKKNFEAIKDLI